MAASVGAAVAVIVSSVPSFKARELLAVCLTFGTRTDHCFGCQKLAALESFAPAMGRSGAERENEGCKKSGGPHEARTRDLRVANAQRKKP